jgi:hypothetical protein
MLFYFTIKYYVIQHVHCTCTITSNNKNMRASIYEMVTNW